MVSQLSTDSPVDFLQNLTALSALDESKALPLFDRIWTSLAQSMTTFAIHKMFKGKTPHHRLLLQVTPVNTKNISSLEKFLQKTQYIGGHLPTRDDHDAFEAFKDNGNVDPSAHPYTFAWFNHISRFGARVTRSWTNSEYEKERMELLKDK